MIKIRISRKETKRIQQAVYNGLFFHSKTCLSFLEKCGALAKKILKTYNTINKATTQVTNNYSFKFGTKCTDS